MSMDLYFEEDVGQEAPAPPDPAASLHALAWCLRAVAQGWALDPRERSAALDLLARDMEGVSTADLQAAVRLLQASRRLSGRRRDQASQLSIRFAEALRSKHGQGCTIGSWLN